VVPDGLPLFSALLNYRHNQKARQAKSLPGVTFLSGEERTNYPLVLSIEDNGNSLGLTPQVISPMSAARIGAYMQQVLESMLNALTQTPQQQLRTLAVIPPEERMLLLHTWNQITVTYPTDQCLHQLFEMQVERDGQAIAVECKGETMSYAELNAQSNQLAHYLIARGVEPDDRIALCVERNVKMLVAILGTMKAGGAYVPLDPVYPSQRLTHILEDSSPIFLLADAVGRKALGNHHVLVVDLDESLPDDLPIENLDHIKLELTPNNLAYVIYTSGSTGTPKGVMVEHRQIVRLFEVTRDKFDFSKQDKWCLFHSFSFDFSVWEIWGALLNGSELSIVPYSMTHSTDEFYDWICASGITVLNQTPSVFKLLMQSKNVSSRTDRLRYVIFGGESLDPTIVREWHENYSKCQTMLVNLYGTTETTIHATYQLLETVENACAIGRPLADLCAYLLDEHGEPVPLGAEGELYIGGGGVTRGYLNCPDLTAERFLPNSFSDNPAARMYCTGDRARYLPDGNLVYLGRTDQQVKIRGFRIEPGEIQARLVEHPHVHEAVVQSYGNGSDARLVAYVVTDSDTPLAQDLRTHLSNLLPYYMVPAAYVCLPSLPLTPNGKLDRRALPAPDEDAFARQQYEAPQGDVEEKLADIWRELLSIERISRHDNFFALGGHSLSVVRLLAQLRHIGLDTTVRKVFDAPTLAMMASTLAPYQRNNVPPNLITTDSTAITPEMLPLITLSQTEIDAIIAQVPEGVANIQDIYGLTSLQHGMLFHHMMAKQVDPYLTAIRLSFIDRTTLERYADALQQVIARHDILRTVFIWKGLNEPAQVVLRHVPSPFIVLDTAEPVLDQLTQQFNARLYRLDLTQAPLLRLLAAPISEGSWLVLQLMHHIIGDHATLELLQAEIHSIANEQSGKLIMPTPFRHLVAQAQLGASPGEHKRFFTKMLGDIDEPTLPFGLCDVGGDRTEIDEALLMLPQTLNDQLRAHARKLQISLASICHLAWAQVLARASGREAVVFGTVLLGRLQAGEVNNNIMGPMINTLPIRIDINNTGVETAVRHTHARLSALLAHEHASLVLAQRCSGVGDGLPLFSSLLNYLHIHPTDQVNSEFPGVNVIDAEERTNYPLTMSVGDDGSSLIMRAQIILPTFAARVGFYMQHSLESMVDALMHTPQHPVRTLTVIPPQERTLLLHTWNQTSVTFPPKSCLHQLFEEQVERDGQAIAIEYKDEMLTYSELNAQSNRLAHYLIARGFKLDNRVALCVERSTKMIVTMLGILKAGGAYVPLDPAYPSQRLTNILHDADPTFLLVDTTGRRAFGDHQVPVIDLNTPLPADLSIDNPKATNLGLTPNHLAYVIYTSGSTGTPKGVMVEHQHAELLIRSVYNIYDFTKEDKWCLFHSVSFDFSVWEIWAALFCGSQLSIVPYNIIRSPDEFFDWICTNGITVLNQTPSAFKMLMRAKCVSSRSDRLRYVLFGGEALDPSIVKYWNEKFDKIQTVLVNMYGPTETVVFATSWTVNDAIISINSLVSIGRPLPNKRIFLLDAHGEPVPLGAEGELYIGGDGVARGYFNCPEFTAERFLPDPFSDNPAARMYRTGDRARYLPNGNLIYLGRADSQVKIRGFRIEPGEIEAHLVAHHLVHEAVVQPRGNGSDACLVAYVVADANTLKAQDLRTYLSTLLPDYMVPAAYVCLPSLPLTPNGKLDRRALPPPDDEAFSHQQYEAPQGDMEEKLADIWRELLSIERISRYDNFFALGGHSLLVVRMLAQLRNIGLDTTVRKVFDAPTLTILASTLDRRKEVTIPPNLITTDSTAITPEMLLLITLSQAEIDAIIAQVPGGVANIQDIYGLAPLQNGMLFHHIKAERGDPYLLIHRMRFTDRTALERYADALQQVVLRHDILRTVFIWEGLNEPAQVVLRRVPPLLTEITLDHTGESVLEQLSFRFNPRHYHLELTQAPLLRLVASPASKGSWVALQLMHHIITDHSTLETLVTEVHAIINEKIEELTAHTSFRNHVAQARLGTGPDEHKRFFTKILGDIDEPTLPFDLRDVDLDGTATNQSNLKLPQRLNDHLRGHARKLQVSLASVCHLAWAQVLARASGREAVVFGTVLLGRFQTGEYNNNIMGPMINTLPIRIDVDNTPVETSVRLTHARLSALLAHEHAPLVLAQRCSRCPAGLPLFTAILNYRHNQKAEQVTASLPGITYFSGEERTNYPLVMSVEDDGDSLGLTPQVTSSMSAARICGYMQQTLKSLAYTLAQTPQQQLRTLPVIPQEERTLLLYTWNQITVIYPPARCLHQLFEAQVECDGQAIAVECNGEVLSYSELNTQANRLAHYLIARGVKPDDLIALCVERNTKMLIAMLGILKAGGAYVPLDPVYPSQRLNNILQDADPIFLLADVTGQKILGDHQVSVVDLENPLPAGFPISNPDAIEIGLRLNHLAYVIYTSGSTGIPKGVMIEHQQVVRLFELTREKFNFNKQDKWCWFHSISFDFSIWEIWGAFSNGSQLSIVPYNITRSPDEFYDWICTNGITVLNQTPSAFKTLMCAKNVSSQSYRLRYVICGGEALDPLIVRDWYEKNAENQTVIINMYGPTETVIFATSWISDVTNSKSSLMPIGRPLFNKRIYLLDAHGEPVPLGAEGEIYIGGDGVARGYLNRPEITAKRFLLDPFRDDQMARMYRTGDRARHMPDGNLVYLGRTDHQVKIRGFRIEPGEIEACLVEHPEVREAVVQPYGNGSDARLVAYVVTDADTSLAQDLRTYLSTLLPDYMIPAAYVCLPSLPLTPNGKLDRRALPAPDDKAFAHQQYEAPQGEMEEKLANIWRDLLSIDRISRLDNFFALGGHSLLVVRLLAQLRQIGLDTTVRKVFDSPTVAMMASTLAPYQTVIIPPNLITPDSKTITPEMLPLFTLSQSEIDIIIAQAPGGVANIQDVYGLTSLQYGMLFHHIKSERGDPYLLVSRMQFTDRTVLECYSDAMQQVVARHDILRTVFIWEGLSEPAQVVLRQVPSILTEITLDDTGKSIIEQLNHKFDPRHYRLDLTKAPLLRLMAAPTSDESWVALQLMHHSIIDHETQERLQTEVHTIINRKTEMLTTPNPFRNFMSQVRLEVDTAQLTSFFTKMLGDIDEPTLPFGLNDVGRDGTDINETYLMLPQIIYNQLRVHARNLKVSLASICHLAWAQVLSRASGHDKVVFGTVLFGRLQTGEGNNNIMGPMINTLPIRIDIDEAGVEIAVRQTHSRLSALLAHEHASLVLAQRCSGFPDGLPLFSALLNYRHNQQTGQVALFPGVTFLGVEERTNYPLTLSLDDNDAALCLSVHVVSPMSAARIDAYMQHTLVSIADALTRSPQQPVRTLTVMPSEERTLLLHTWNKTMFTYPPARCLHQLFEVQVEREGEAIAVECNGEVLSYSELNARSNQLAHYLIARGIKSDDRIALCVERSITMLIAMLGILKAGGAYVPLDPVYPSQRLTHILKDADPTFLLADATGRKALGDHQVPVVDLEKVLPADVPIDNPDTIKLGLTANHLAYVIYTSGSTGIPKGVMIEHQQIVRLFEVARDKFNFNKQDKWCLFHSFSFDVSVWEIWGAFFNGSQLSIISYNTARSTDEFYDWICTRGITVLNQTPSVFKSLMRAKNIILRFDRLRYVIFAGEVFDPLIAKEWWKKYDQSRTVLVNMYGPTETAHVTYQRLESLENVHSIGRPLADLCVYLLDPYGEPVLLGAEGELYIGGAGVARGYFNRPKLTAERFLPDPFSGNPSARMYRTGDRARYLPDGNLIFLGRIDQQVKIRGFRIEPGEIEAHLVEHPHVYEAIVQSYDNVSDARLVAYVVAEQGTSFAQELRTYLSTLLPDYMIPAAYVCLPSLPLTPNGKLDRRALSPPDDDAFARQHYESPHSEIEEKLADIWRELLSVEHISRHDNFFALGGHSLLVVRLLAQLRHIGFDTTVREVFDAPSLATLAATLTRYQEVNIPPNMITSGCTAITPEMLPLINLNQAEIDAIVAQVPDGVANIQDIYGLAPLQHGMLFHHIMAEEEDPYLLISQLSFIDRTTLELYADALKQVIKRHDILRTVIIWEGLSEPAQVVLRQVPSLLTEVTLDGASESVLENLIHQFGLRCYRLDLTKAPLLRLYAAPTSKGNWVVLQLTHHSIIDHSTLERLEAEVHDIMNGKIEDLTTPTPFRYFVAQARLGVSQAKHFHFFTEMLGDIDEPTVPFGLSGTGLYGTEINEAHLMLPQMQNNQVREIARQSRVSLSSLCHLAWAQVLARTSGREAVVLGTVLLGRLQAGEGHDTVMGPTINTLPIRINIDERSVETAVRHTHARLSALLAHEHAPLVLAQRCSGVPPGLPLFSSLLNYRHKGKREGHATYPGVSLLGGVALTTYPLTMSFDDNDEELCLSVHVLSPLSAIRICAYMQQSLESLTNALTQTPQQQLRTLAVIPPEERVLLLHTWNQTTFTYPTAQCLHQLFETQVERDAQAIAVECKGETMSYAELNAQSNQLAHYLIARGVKPDDRIALCVERNMKMLVAILGTLKAGGAYVPLDPAYPSQRLNHILKDANPIFLLADAVGRNVLGDHQVPVIELDKPLPAGLPIGNLDTTKLALTPTHLAYVIYTSGSTGTPKGVMVEHRDAAQLVMSVHDQFDFNSQDKWSLFYSISFDVSVWEIWGALCYGSQLSIPPYDTARSADKFYDWICTNGITVLNQTPSAFKMLILAKNISLRHIGLRYVIFVGEPLDALIVRDWYEKHDKDRTVLINMYGPTETVIFTTSCICNIEMPDNYLVPIGRPLPNRRIYLLDMLGEPVPLGTEGEVYIGGDGVARGYLNRSDLTAERFLPDPFSNNPSARMYRTGDRARYLHDGNLVYLGRTDEQVKIRGFRIEPGEIETRLVEHPQVQDAVVQSYGNGSDARLVAYVVTDADTSLAQDLRTYLSTLLPDYMVPTAFVSLPSLPLTPNGKLDRHALPAPNDKAFAHQQYEAPQGEIEEKLADIWRELLGIDRISRYDNFFELGGHSLFVMHVVNKAKLYNMHIYARGVFSFPILKDLAEQITKRTNRLYCDAAIPVRQYGNETPLFLLPEGQGGISYAFELAHNIDKTISVFVLPWPSPENKQPSSIEEMACVMISLMKKIQANSPYAIAGYSAGGILAYEIAKQLINSGNSVSFLGLIDTYPPIKNILSETEMFSTSLLYKFPVFQTLNDSKWWERVSRLTLNEAIEEIKKTNVDLKNTDIEWEALLSKQRHHYRHICAAFKFDSLPIKVHLFKAVDQHTLPACIAHLNNVYKNEMDLFEKLYSYPMLGWENVNSSTDVYVILVDGDHGTIMSDQKNRAYLGKQITKLHRQGQNH
ncbi:uncharacterized protein LOC129569885, partial [Sitodiplosis mosellana]|uniref:uncharacterized protein LOC129569885 n=1 Tax=Sitodiplosis mosellana TaxID=263140 RepID=UPI0024439007